jgi:hypothetical protein
MMSKNEVELNPLPGAERRWGGEKLVKGNKDTITNKLFLVPGCIIYLTELRYIAKLG